MIIKKEFNFYAGVHISDTYYINSYNMECSFVNTDNSDYAEMSVAIDRIEHFIYRVLQHSVIISEEHTSAIKKYKAAGINICELPIDPLDEILASILILKINAILEGKIKLINMALDSHMSEGMRFVIAPEEIKSLSYNGNHFWWNKSNLCMSKLNKSNVDNVVKLFDGSKEWEQLGLSWASKKQ